MSNYGSARCIALDSGWTRNIDISVNAGSIRIGIRSAIRKACSGEVREGMVQRERDVGRKDETVGKALLCLDIAIWAINDKERSHWALAIIRPNERKIEYYDSADGKVLAGKLRCIWRLLEDQLGVEFKQAEWNVVVIKSPAQHNRFDCGVFVCITALAVVGGQDIWSFVRQANMNNNRRLIGAVIINRGFKGDFHPYNLGID